MLHHSVVTKVVAQVGDPRDTLQQGLVAGLHGAHDHVVVMVGGGQRTWPPQFTTHFVELMERRHGRLRSSDRQQVGRVRVALGTLLAALFNNFAEDLLQLLTGLVAALRTGERQCQDPWQEHTNRHKRGLHLCQ